MNDWQITGIRKVTFTNHIHQTSLCKAFFLSFTPQDWLEQLLQQMWSSLLCINSRVFVRVEIINKRSACRLTSVPYLDRAAFASCRIFSRYIWAARLLYLALVSLVEQPCWRKKAVCTQKENVHEKKWQTIETDATDKPENQPTHRISVPSDLHAPKLEPVPVGVQLRGSEEKKRSMQTVNTGPAIIWSLGLHNGLKPFNILTRQSSHWAPVDTWWWEQVSMHHLMKLRWTPSERWIPEQSMHKNTPCEMLAQLGFLAAQSKHAWNQRSN